jgi:hypothetical protein
MGWEDQGRQEHGWFSHGTSGKSGTPPESGGSGERVPDLGDRIRFTAFAALGRLPPAARPLFEARLNGGGLERLQQAATAWAAAAGLPLTEFQRRLLDGTGGAPVAALLHRVARTIAQASGTDDLSPAVVALADAVQRVGVESWPRFVRAAAERAGEPAKPHAEAAGSADSSTGRSGSWATEQNVQDLAALIQTEAGGTTPAAMTAVGATVLNRMRRNGVSTVQQV